MKLAAFPRECPAGTATCARRIRSAAPTIRVLVWPLGLLLPPQTWRHGEPEIQWVLPRKCRAPGSVQAKPQSFRLRFLLSTLLLSIRKLLYAILAGVPGFEPGLSVLETDVLTVDTIPLRVRSGASRFA